MGTLFLGKQVSKNLKKEKEGKLKKVQKVVNIVGLKQKVHQNLTIKKILENRKPENLKSAWAVKSKEGKREDEFLSTTKIHFVIFTQLKTSFFNKAIWFK